MLEVLGQNFVTTARAKGLGERRVILGHALKNAAVPVVTLIGLQFGTLLGGAVVTETIFAWPGVGRLAVQSIFVRDYPVVQAGVLRAGARPSWRSTCSSISSTARSIPRIRDE